MDFGRFFSKLGQTLTIERNLELPGDAEVKHFQSKVSEYNASANYAHNLSFEDREFIKLGSNGIIPPKKFDEDRKCRDFTEVWSTDDVKEHKPKFFGRFLTPRYDTKKYIKVGDAFTTSSNNNNVMVYLLPIDSPIYQFPTDFDLIWSDAGTKSKKDIKVWRPVAPCGYVPVGTVVTSGEKPAINEVACIWHQLVTEEKVQTLWSDAGTGAKSDCIVYIKKSNIADETFIASSKILSTHYQLY